MDNEEKVLNYDEFRNIFVENATVSWLKQNGLDPSDPKTPAIEIDENEPTSQLVGWKATAEEAFDFFMDTLRDVTNRGYSMDFGDEEPEEEEESKSSWIRDWADENLGGGRKLPNSTKKERPQSVIEKSGVVFVFLNPPPGTPMTVADVREWLQEVDNLRIPDSEEIEGQLFVDYDMTVHEASRSQCIYCKEEDDVNLVVHECKAGEEDV